MWINGTVFSVLFSPLFFVSVLVGMCPYAQYIYREVEL